MDERVARGAGERPDLWGYVLREGEKTEEGEIMDVQDMYANATIFMLAGSETSATLLSGLVYLLCRNPEKMKALCAEVRGQEGGELDVEALPRMKYLAACIDEAMRLYPPLPIGPPREVHREGNVICGKWVPGKVCVLVFEVYLYSLTIAAGRLVWLLPSTRLITLRCISRTPRRLFQSAGSPILDMTMIGEMSCNLSPTAHGIV